MLATLPTSAVMGEARSGRYTRSHSQVSRGRGGAVSFATGQARGGVGHSTDSRTSRRKQAEQDEKAKASAKRSVAMASAV